MKKEYVKFDTRASRTNFVYDRYGKYFGCNILDVGCFEAPLRKVLGNKTKYLGIDIDGEPDMVVNLEHSSKLPFSDDEFNFVMCIEVLEHIDNLHIIFEDLFRVSSKYILVSLPNCWSVARRKIERGCGEFSHYGLPFSKPTDRHKWFFNFSQAQDFFHQKETNRLKLIDLRVVEKPRFTAIKAFRKFLYPGERYFNRYAHTLFALYQKI